jgi:hypothetical protein
VSNRYYESLDLRKERIDERLDRQVFPESPGVVFRSGQAHYEVSDRIVATDAGGIAAVHAMVRRLGLDRELNESLHLLKRHLPYHESDHVLNIAYSILAGGTKLEDIELLRQDEAYMDLLGAARIPDPTTAGDFLRRFQEASMGEYQEAVNRVRRRVWRSQPVGSLGDTAMIDVDGSLTPTYGEKKAGMGYCSYKKVWGYHPLLVSLANTKEPLSLMNRPGNDASHQGCVKWVNQAIELCEEAFEDVLLRGDTDFSLTGEFDGWTDRGVRFVLGYDAHPNLVRIATELPEEAYFELERLPRYEPFGPVRRKRDNTKEQIVIEKEFENIKLRGEDIAEFPYRPVKCKQEYRMVAVRKNLTVMEGDRALFDDVRYFFYVTNDRFMPMEEVVAHANARCDQENLIEQLKNGVNALRVPMHDLLSNWAYMAIASLAWTLKAWFAMTLKQQQNRDEVLTMEFKRFVNTVIRVPAQVLHGARRIRVRLLAYRERAWMLLESLETMRAWGFT